jgi:hypothetical protein
MRHEPAIALITTLGTGASDVLLAGAFLFHRYAARFCVPFAITASKDVARTMRRPPMWTVSSVPFETSFHAVVRPTPSRAAAARTE